MLGRIRAVRHSSSRIYAHFALSADLSTASREGQADVAIVGAGHNGLVAATLLARQGLKVSWIDKAAIRPSIHSAV